MRDSENITEMLEAANEGDENSLERLIPVVESELRRIAHNYMRRENPNHTLQTTALVNEAYLKLIGQNRLKWQNRAHFFAIAAKVMRRILLNHARDKKAGKRGAGAVHLNIEDIDILSDEKAEELIALDEALERLNKFDKLKSQIVELRYFGGLTVQETAEALGISASSVLLHWRMARAWLKSNIDENQ
jgi:RNA polymerase sigma factor (TIGR02999 family)